MEKLNSFAASPGADFYGAFQAADPSNSAIDSEIASYLNNNPDGIEFSYGGKDYLLAKDQTTNKYTLHLQTPSGSVLKDEDVQMNTKYAPDGFVEIGGLSKAGTRLFIGRAPDNVEQVIAFEGAHDTSDVSFRPENAVVLYDGSKKPTTEEPVKPEDPVAGSEQPDEPVDFGDVYNGWTGGGEPAEPPKSETDGDEATVPTNTSPATGDTNTEPPVSDDVAYVDPSITVNETNTDPVDNTFTEDDYLVPEELLVDGQYEVKGDRRWYNSAGESPGLAYCEPGVYEVKGGELFRQLDVGDGSKVFIPADSFNGDYLVGSTFTNQNGEEQVASFEFLSQIGVPTYLMSIPLADLTTNVNGVFSVISKDDFNLVVDAEGTVVGRESFLPPGNYMIKKDSEQAIIYREFVSENGKVLFIPTEGNRGAYAASGQDILDEQGNPAKNEDGSQMKATRERLEWLGLFS